MSNNIKIAENLFYTYNNILLTLNNSKMYASYDETLENCGVITDLVCDRIIELLGLENNGKNFSFICTKVQVMNGNFDDIINYYNSQKLN